MTLPIFTVSDYLIQRLSEMGIGHLFAVPGDYAGPFLSRIDAGNTIQRIGTCNELEAGYAADAYARLRGAGAVCVTYGVGSFSLLNGIAGPYVEQIPVVVIVGSPSQANRAQERSEGVLYHHSTGNLRSNLDAFRNVTVAAEVVESAATAPSLIDRTLTECISWKRPVYLEVCKEVWTQPCAPPERPLQPRLPEESRGALEQAVSEVLARLEAARAPVIWAGVEIQRLGLQDALEQLVRRSGLPFASDLLGKSTLAENTPGFVGVYSGAAAGASVRELVERSDCLIALGVLITDDFLDLIDDSYGTMILSWNDRVRIGYHEYRTVPLGSFLQLLTLRLIERSYHAPDTATATFQPLRARRSRLLGLAAPQPDQQITYEALFQRMTTFIDDSMIVLADESNSLYVAADLPIHQRNGFIAQSAWGSIGYTIGAVVGVGFAAPDKRAVVFAGDGGFRMICQALATVAHYRQGAIVFVMRNNLYGIEQALVNLAFYTEDQPPEAFNVLPAWHYTQLTQVFGGKGYVVETTGDLERVLEHVRANTDTLSLVEVRVPERDLPPQIKRLAEDPG